MTHFARGISSQPTYHCLRCLAQSYPPSSRRHNLRPALSLSITSAARMSLRGQHWKSRAIEPNAFLSPHFVIPAARHLTPDQTPLALFVERTTPSGRELIGVGVFTEAAATYRTPVRRLVGYRSRYSLLSGLLLDREHAVQALQALLQFVRTSLPHCKAIELPLVRGDGPLFDPAGIAADASTHAPRIGKLDPRAVLVMADCAAHLGEKTLAARIRDIDRRLRRLRERGHVAWRWHREAGATAQAVESFLSLEHMGWKGDEGSSLRSRPDDEAFFRAAVSGFASEGRALFIEVTFDGVPIASMCNFIAGNVGFGFKIGWNPAFRSFSPALINELELIRQGPTSFGDIEYFDSGASAFIVHQRAVAGTPPDGHDMHSNRVGWGFIDCDCRLGGAVEATRPQYRQIGCGCSRARFDEGQYARVIEVSCG